MTGLLPQLSAAVASLVEAGLVSPPHWTVASVGQLVITGGVVSAKAMCWTQLVLLPQASSTVQVRSIPA